VEEGERPHETFKVDAKLTKGSLKKREKMMRRAKTNSFESNGEEEQREMTNDRFQANVKRSICRTAEGNGGKWWVRGHTNYHQNKKMGENDEEFVFTLTEPEVTKSDSFCTSCFVSSDKDEILICRMIN
jgi:hypothetical protein